jgi:hypothetical protein
VFINLIVNAHYHEIFKNITCPLVSAEVIPELSGRKKKERKLSRVSWMSLKPAVYGLQRFYSLFCPFPFTIHL